VSRASLEGSVSSRRDAGIDRGGEFTAGIDDRMRRKEASPSKPKPVVPDPRVGDRSTAQRTSRLVDATVEELEEEGHAVPIAHVDGCVYRVGPKQVRIVAEGMSIYSNYVHIW